MSKNDGGPAFPTALWDGHTVTSDGKQHLTQVGGMTLRDYFAAKAMQAMVTHYGTRDMDDCPPLAYELADAMLAERSKS